jgi:hypothetical protein
MEFGGYLDNHFLAVIVTTYLNLLVSVGKDIGQNNVVA